jgi:hypothetical protein
MYGWVAIWPFFKAFEEKKNLIRPSLTKFEIKKQQYVMIMQICFENFSFF